MVRIGRCFVVAVALAWLTCGVARGADGEGQVGPASRPGAGAAAESFPVAIRVDASKSLGELRRIWRFFGADEPNYGTMTNGRKLIGELGSSTRSTFTFGRTTC